MHRKTQWSRAVLFARAPRSANENFQPASVPHLLAQKPSSSQNTRLNVRARAFSLWRPTRVQVTKGLGESLESEER